MILYKNKFPALTSHHSEFLDNKYLLLNRQNRNEESTLCRMVCSHRKLADLPSAHFFESPKMKNGYMDTSKCVLIQPLIAMGARWTLK